MARKRLAALEALAESATTAQDEASFVRAVLAFNSERGYAVTSYSALLFAGTVVLWVDVYRAVVAIGGAAAVTAQAAWPDVCAHLGVRARIDPCRAALMSAVCFARFPCGFSTRRAFCGIGTRARFCRLRRPLRCTWRRRTMPNVFALLRPWAFCR